MPDLLRTGSHASVKLNSFPTRIFRGDVVVVSPQGNSCRAIREYFSRELRSPTPMAQFAQAWRDKEKCAWDGIRPVMSCFVNHCCGSIHEHGRGLECEGMQSRKPSDLALILLSAALLPWLACSQKNVEVAAAPFPSTSGGSAPAPAASVPSGNGGFTVSGPLIVEHQLDVLAQREGVIAELRSEAGAHVRAGDILAQFDDRQLVADLEAARAKTRSIEADLKNWEAEAKVMQADYERAQKMWDAQILTKEQLEHAKFKAESETWDVKRVRELLTNARQSERSLELELDKTRIRAPFSGVVARRYVRQGQQVAKGDRLFWVSAEGPLGMRFTLPEKFIGVLKVGQPLALTSPDFPGKEYRARVIELSPVIDPTSGTIDGMVEVVGPTVPLRPGMNVILGINTHP
jgi:RND family efflux transporter MFP subunit